MDSNHIHVCNITICDYHNLDEKINKNIACVIDYRWHLIHNQVIFAIVFVINIFYQPYICDWMTSGISTIAIIYQRVQIFFG
jgi:hypothetical protein